MNGEIALQGMASECKRGRGAPVVLEANGELTADRQEWLRGAVEFAKARLSLWL